MVPARFVARAVAMHANAEPTLPYLNDQLLARHRVEILVHAHLQLPVLQIAFACVRTRSREAGDSVSATWCHQRPPRRAPLRARVWPAWRCPSSAIQRALSRTRAPTDPRVPPAGEAAPPGLHREIAPGPIAVVPPQPGAPDDAGPDTPQPR